MGRDFDPNRPRTPSQLRPLKIPTYQRPCSSRACRIGPRRRRAVLYAPQSERGPRGGRPRGEGGRPRRSRSQDFHDPRRNPRSAGRGARCACNVRADLDVGPCPTHTGASTGAVAGGGEARATACGTGQVAIFAIRCRVLYRLWGCLLGVRECLVRTTVFLECVRK